MRLLICDKKQINYYNIPKKTKDNYLITYNNIEKNISEPINLEAEDNTWTIKSNYGMQIYDKMQKKDKIVIKPYEKYRIVFTDINKEIMIHVVPDFETYFEINTIESMSIGSSKNNNIIYSDQSIMQNQITITKNNGIFIVNNINDNPSLYVNDKCLKTKILKFGDRIFINGLKIIWLENTVRINNPNNLVSISNLNLVKTNSKDMSKYNSVTERERNTTLYNEDEMFFHTPRLQSEIKKEIIKIDIPPQKEQAENTPMILSLGSSVIIGITSSLTGVSAIRGLASKTMETFDAVLELIMCTLMLTACIVFPLLTDLWQKKQIKKREEKRQKKYKEYLNKKVQIINEVINKQSETIRENNITLDEIKKRINNKSSNIWSREIIDDDFLTIRLGIGNLDAQLEIDTQLEEFSLYDDNLKDSVEKIVKGERKNIDVPITISMVKNKVTPFIINSNFKQNYIDSIMLQLLYYYSSLDLKIIIFTNEENKDKWEYIKYDLHNFNNDKTKRFFATNENEISQISLYLEQEYDKRLNSNENEKKDETIKSKDNKSLYKNYDEFYLIITDDFKEIKNTPIITRILDSNLNIGFSLMIIEDKINNLPSRLEKFINISNNISGIYNRSLNGEGQVQFKPEFINNGEIEEYAKKISNIPVSLNNKTTSIPASLTFLDMYNAGKVDQLNILTRWKENNPVNSINAIVGFKKGNKPIGLDLHEKYHGPHGLIAGSTGSGKSEFIITYILSMAINYHPDEVQFVLIDYKGGGLAGAFENKETKVILPHLVGTITNLDTSEMHRTLVSIQSEMKRRQVIFNEARDMLGEGTIDIYKYQKLYREGKVKKPIAHLFVISDEFAELKQQNPDFMSELVQAARIGRSLGVHLILATQKPAGVVDDQIWSNSHFKVCLKVQTTEDSMEMLKKPDAAEIKETGRFYLQVGNDELFELGQSAWAGAKYFPIDRVMKKINDSIDIINNDGSIIKTINNKINIENTNYGEQMTNIVKYLYDLAISENIKFNTLWLPNIPKDIYIYDLIKEYDYKEITYKINPIIGKYDKPEKQMQGLFTLDINNKNTIIFGMPGSGKEELILSLIYSACLYHTPQEINFYILDFGSEALNIINRLPQIGDYITSSTQNKVEAEFEFLDNEISKRKKLFANYGGNYDNYCKESGNTVPIIATIINTYETFMENNVNLDDYMIHLLREGSKYGIVFIINVVSTNSIRSSILEYFSNKIILQTTDPFDYQYILGAEQGAVPSKIYGRGMTKIDEEVCEFQTAKIAKQENKNNTIKSFIINSVNTFKIKAPEIKIMPKTVQLEKLFRYVKSLNKIPIGYSKDTIELEYYDFTKKKCHIITGENIIDDMTFMAGIIDLIDYVKEINFNVFDITNSIETDGNMNYYNSNYQIGFNDILTNSKTTVNMFIGIGDYHNNLIDEELVTFEKIMNNINKMNNQIFIFIDNYNRMTKLLDASWFKNIDKNTGIWYGKDLDFQTIFKINDKDNFENTDLKDIVYIVENGEYKIIKGIGKEDEGLF